MEEYQHGIYSSQHYSTSRRLARQSHQPYEADDLDDTPLEEESNVLPLPNQPRSQESLAEDIIGRSGKRRSSGSAQRKTKATTGKAKTSKAARSTAVNPQLFVDEVQKLAARADRINQILAERARRRDEEQSQTVADRSTPVDQVANAQQQSFQQQSPQQYQQPYQGVSLPTGYDWPVSASLEPESAKSVSQPWNPQAWEERLDPRQQQQAKQDAWQTAQDLRYLNHPESVAYGGERFSGLEEQRPALRQRLGMAPAARSSGLPSRPSGWGWFLELPRKFTERITDAAIWIGVGAIARMLFRFILMVLPGLSPVFTLLMLSPAMLAVMLVLFFPRMGWVPIYRLFLITLGLLIASKF